MKLNVYKNGQRVEDINLNDIYKDHASSDSFEFSVGRSGDCHVVLNDPQISRMHASIVKTAGAGWEIVRKSTFGSLMVNGTSPEKHLLCNGDVLTLGPFQLHVVLENDVLLEIPVVADPIVLSDDESEIVEVETTTREVLEEESAADLSSADEVEESIEVNESDEPGEPDEVDESDDNNDEATEKSEESVESDFSDDFEGETKDEDFSSDEGEGEFSAGEDDFSSDETNGMGMEMMSDDNEKTSIMTSFVNFELMISGEFAPYDRYELSEKEVFIGRDAEKCQLVLQDDEVSSVHAVIRKGLIGYSLEDLNSSNGTLLQGERINKAELNEGDEFVIGATSFSVNVQSELLSTEQGNLMPVDENQEIVVEEVVEEEVDFGEGDFSGDEAVPEASKGGKRSLVDKWKALPPKRKLIYGVIGLALIAFLLGGEEEQKGPSKKGTVKKAGSEYALTKKDKKKVVRGVKNRKKTKLSKENLEFAEAAYQLGKTKLHAGKYNEAIQELTKIISLDPDFKNTQQLIATAKEGLKKLEDINRKIREEEDRKIRQAKIKKILEKATLAVKERNVNLAESLFAQIFELDPENIDVPQLKLELDAWKKEQERKALAKAQKEAERERMVTALAPGKGYYLKKEWYKATIRLEEFLQAKKIDEDLITEGQKMLSESRRNLNMMIAPLLGKARSLKEGQDLKMAYETYLEIAALNPSHSDALNEMSDIREVLRKRSRKVYREALISESLSLFDEAREKFQEVQQISPSDSEYYKKATEKLDTYWD